MDKSNIKLTSAEISTLWKSYIQCTALRCFFKHFQQYVKDVDIKPIVDEVVERVDTTISDIKTIYDKENYPIPEGFSDKDIDFNAPPLYTDLFALSFIYRSGQIIIPHYANTLTKVSRLDLYSFFATCMGEQTNLHKKAMDLMLSKGIYDRPPKMEYPTEVEFITHQPTLIDTWLGDKSPLNTIELAELFTGVERNAIGMNLIMGLIQVTRDKEIKDYLLKGKKLAEKQIEKFDKFLRENDHFIGFPTTMEVTNSTVPPFSEKLILFIISTTNQVAVSALGDSLSVSMRKDLGAEYSKIIMEILKYGEDGLKLLIDRGWMEQPPRPIDRKKFYKK